MKMILQEHMRYADLINRALEFGELCLTRNCSLYPYALISIDSDVQNVFLDGTEQHDPSSMIEALEQQISQRTCQASSAVGILVYAVTVINEHNEDSDALMFSITDSNGSNTLTIYPYTRHEKGIKIGSPYTCDFLN